MNVRNVECNAQIGLLGTECPELIAWNGTLRTEFPERNARNGMPNVTVRSVYGGRNGMPVIQYRVPFV